MGTSNISVITSLLREAILYVPENVLKNILLDSDVIDESRIDKLISNGKECEKLHAEWLIKYELDAVKKEDNDELGFKVGRHTGELYVIGEAFLSNF